MSIEGKESSYRSGAQQPAPSRECQTVPLDELKRQLGLSLIEAARAQFGGEANVSPMGYRR